MDGDVQRLVLGRELPGGRPASLPGQAVRRVRGTAYPVICREPAARARGTAYSGLSEADASALDRYEGPEYRREAMEVELADGSRVTAELYLPCAPVPTEERPWELESWQAEEKSAFLGAYFP